MKNIWLWVFSIWSSISVFSHTDLYDDLQEQMAQNVHNEEYEFVPDEGSPGVEVAPLKVNSQDQDVPLAKPDLAAKNPQETDTEVNTEVNEEE